MRSVPSLRNLIPEENNMNKTLRSLLLSAMVAALPAAAVMANETPTLRIATEGAYPPFNYFTADGKLAGFDIEIGRALCAKMQAKCSFVAQDWDGIIPALQTNKCDIILAGMNATEERKKQVDFTTPYSKTPIWMIGPKATKSNDISPATLKGKSIGAQGSTIHANYVEKFYKDSTARLYPTQEEANLDLLNGRLDYIVADALALADFLKGQGKSCCKLIAEVKRDDAIHGAGVAGAVRKADTALKAMFDKAIAETTADGSNQKIQDKWLKFSK